MSYKDKRYVVYIKKCFHLKDGTIKESISCYGYNTILGARRCLKNMKARQDVIYGWINQ